MLSYNILIVIYHNSRSPAAPEQRGPERRRPFSGGTACLTLLVEGRKARIERFELEQLELRDSSSTRVSNRIIPPSEPGSLHSYIML